VRRGAAALVSGSLEAKAEGIFDELNNHHQGMVASAVYCMKKRARKCLRAMGGTFEGRRV